MEEMILFISDIKFDDSRSSLKLLRPLLKYLSGYEYIMLAPNTACSIEKNIIGFPLPFYKNKNSLLRVVSEMLLPIMAFIYFIIHSRSVFFKIDKIIAYSPSIFVVFFLIIYKAVNYSRKIKSFLILRDIFPDWSINAGLIRNGLIIKVLRKIAQLQFSYFDITGVQDQDAILYLNQNYDVKSKLVVLPNWLEDQKLIISKTDKYPWKQSFEKSEVNLIYTGNLGPAQDLKQFFIALKSVNVNILKNVCIHIFGDGIEYSALTNYQNYINISNFNIYFWGSVSEEECSAALILSSGAFFTLNRSMNVNNIPGKYMQYTQLNLPIFASVNPKNPVIDQINDTNIGLASSFDNSNDLAKGIERFIIGIREKTFSDSRKIYDIMFSFETAGANLTDWINQK
jgi:hypothetical protein